MNCILCGKPAGGTCDVCGHVLSPDICLHCHKQWNHTLVPTDLLERAQRDRDCDGLLIHGDSDGR